MTRVFVDGVLQGDFADAVTRHVAAGTVLEFGDNVVLVERFAHVYGVDGMSISAHSQRP